LNSQSPAYHRKGCWAPSAFQTECPLIFFHYVQLIEADRNGCLLAIMLKDTHGSGFRNGH
jgi:hypothetical protein